MTAKVQDAVAALQEGKAEAVQLEKLRADVPSARLTVLKVLEQSRQPPPHFLGHSTHVDCQVAKMVHEAKTSTSQMRQTVGEAILCA